MRTYKLTIAYDGTAYQGWQRQANTENTLQGILERTISRKRLFKYRAKVLFHSFSIR